MFCGWNGVLTSHQILLGGLCLLQVEIVTGILDTFIVEPFVPHEQSDEYYVCINSNRDGEEFLFCHEGGVDVGDVDAKADRLQVGQRLPLCTTRMFFGL